MVAFASRASILLSAAVVQSLNIAFVPTILTAGFLSFSSNFPTANIPTVIGNLHPLPQQELMLAYSKGNSELVMGRFDSALAELDKAVEVGIDNPNVYVARGIVFEKLFRWQDAVEDYKRANELHKRGFLSRDDPTIISNLANAECGLGQWEDALKDFTLAAKLDTSFVAPQLGRNLVLYQVGSKEEAKNNFQALVDKYPLFADGRAALAVMLVDEGNLEAARTNWGVAMEQDSRYGDVSWVREIRRWPPSLTLALENNLNRLNE